MNVTDLVNGYEVLNTEGGEVVVAAVVAVVVAVVVVVVDDVDVDNNDSLERE